MLYCPTQFESQLLLAVEMSYLLQCLGWKPVATSFERGRAQGQVQWAMGFQISCPKPLLLQLRREERGGKNARMGAGLRQHDESAKLGLQSCWLQASTLPAPAHPLHRHHQNPHLGSHWDSLLLREGGLRRLPISWMEKLRLQVCRLPAGPEGGAGAVEARSPALRACP